MPKVSSSNEGIILRFFKLPKFSRQLKFIHISILGGKLSDVVETIQLPLSFLKANSKQEYLTICFMLMNKSYGHGDICYIIKLNK